MIDYTSGSAIAMALDDLHKAEAIDNEADPRTHLHMREAAVTLANACGLVVSDAEGHAV